MNTVNNHTVNADEDERIRILKKYNILDTPPDGSFDHITRLAADLLRVPIALISLVDKDRIWFKSAVGLNNIRQIDREPGLCSSAIISDDIYIIEDAIRDPRTLTNSLVTGEFGLRFYAAVPVKIREGFNLGTLCVMDKNPRTLIDSEKKLLENLAEILIDQMELRLEARRANSRQNDLLSIVAHELKNSLTTIPAYADVIKAKSEHDMEITQMCNHIKRSAIRMDKMIKEMLDMARLQADQVVLRKSEFDMATIVSHVTATNLVLANAKQQKLFVDLDDNIMIDGDEAKISEVVDNLINNAIKYSPRGSNIYVRLRTKNDKAILQVTDEGPGFTMEDKQKLFLPFTRLSALPTGGENSTGIGLSIVKVMVDAHGGKIIVENNQENHGTTFTVEIPTIRGN